MSNYAVTPIKSKAAAGVTPEQQPRNVYGSINFTANNVNTNIRTSLTTKEEKEKYKVLTQSLDKSNRKVLDYALKTGILLNNDSNDKSSVLDNLYKNSG